MHYAIESDEVNFANDTREGLGTIEFVSSSLGVDATPEINAIQDELNSLDDEAGRIGADAKRQIAAETGEPVKESAESR